MEDKEKKAIIVLWGPQGTGKTTTLRKLALEFLDSPEVEEDIQVGFLLYKKPQENSKENSKVVVSTISGDINQAFCTAFNRSLILVTTTRVKGEEEEGNINVYAEPKKYKDLVQGVASLEKEIKQQEKIDEELKPKIETSIRSIAQEEIATLCPFLQRLLESGVVEGDIQIAFHYKGKRIVISTAGDDRETVNEGRDLFKALKADILVTATRSRGSSRDALKALEEDGEIKTKAIRIYQSNLTHGESNNEEETEPLKESITAEQIEIIRNTINRGQAKIIKSVIDNIIDEWEK